MCSAPGVPVTVEAEAASFFLLGEFYFPSLAQLPLPLPFPAEELRDFCSLSYSSFPPRDTFRAEGEVVSPHVCRGSYLLPARVTPDDTFSRRQQQPLLLLLHAESGRLFS